VLATRKSPAALHEALYGVSVTFVTSRFGAVWRKDKTSFHKTKFTQNSWTAKAQSAGAGDPESNKLQTFRTENNIARLVLDQRSEAKLDYKLKDRVSKCMVTRVTS
jgi:hypothetical protein